MLSVDINWVWAAGSRVPAWPENTADISVVALIGFAKQQINTTSLILVSCSTASNISHLENGPADPIISWALHFQHLLWWHLFFPGTSSNSAARRFQVPSVFVLQLLESAKADTTRRWTAILMDNYFWKDFLWWNNVNIYWVQQNYF